MKKEIVKPKCNDKRQCFAKERGREMRTWLCSKLSPKVSRKCQSLPLEKLFVMRLELFVTPVSRLESLDVKSMTADEVVGWVPWA